MDATTYAEWYQHPDNDVYHGNYAELFALFEADEPPFGPAEILSKVATGVDAKLAFALLSPEGKVLVLHRCRHVQPMLGAPATPNDNLNVAMLGDITPLASIFVDMPANAFTRTANFERVPTPGAITGLLAAFPDETQLIPDPAAPDADVAPVRSRKLTLIPPHLVGQILGATMAPGGLSPRQLWENIAGPLAADNQVAPQVSPFLHWCRLAFAQGQGADNPLQLAIPHL
jgi:hypothetical protein